MGKILFQLTPEIIDLIIFGMENQSGKYFVDIKTGVVLSEIQAEANYGDNFIDSYALPIPDWLSSDGFQLMESFVAALHNPVHKKVLRDVLSAGKGAFRNFKNTVKEDESLTKKWYLHKEKVMRTRVVEWYNLNSEILKYTDIDENTDETESLILSDFVFSKDCSRLKELIDRKSNESILESLGEKEADIAEYFIKKNNTWLSLPDTFPIRICAETLEGEFAGSISGGIIKTEKNKSIVIANAIWVEKKFRGMGLARQLIDDFSKNAVLLKADRIIYELAGKEFTLKSTLEARGFSSFFTTMVVNAEKM